MKDKLDPRQAGFLKNYLDPKSGTFSNAYQSALKAGYRDAYAKEILTKEQEWLGEIVRDWELIGKAEKNLKEFLEDNKDKKVKADITKFVLERLNKKKYSAKTELEHSGEIEQTIKTDEKTQELVGGFIEYLKSQPPKNPEIHL